MRCTLAVFLFTILVGSSAFAQTEPTDPSPFIAKYNLGVGYTNIRANAPPASCRCFDMNAGFVSASTPLRDWLSAAAEIRGGHANDIGPLGQNLTLTTYTAGPQVNFHFARFTPFAQALFGLAHGGDSYFPRGNTYSTTATSFAFTTGGGLDIHLNHRFAIRALEAQYLRTYLPNGTNNGQNHLLLGAGIIFKFHGRYVTPSPRPPDRIAGQPS